jgi:F-type H+-transporting ATPase subunit epsilon
MQLEILTPSRSIFSGEIKLIKVPGSSGSFEIMNNHAAIISALTDGEVKIETESGETLRYKTSGGVVEVRNNHIVVLAESIENHSNVS